MATNEDAWPPSGSIMGLEGGLLSRYVGIMTTIMARKGVGDMSGGRDGWVFDSKTAASSKIKHLNANVR
jgi:hypothetical protein